MSATINTVQTIAALNDWGADFLGGKVVQQTMADLSPTPDVFANFPIPKDIHFVVGYKLKEAIVAAGRAYHYPDVTKPYVECAWYQRDLNTFNLAPTTLAGKYLIFLAQISRVDVSGVAANAAKRDYILLGPCLLEPETDWKVMGNEIKAKFYVEPCASAYGGLTSADATALAALPVPPSTTLAAADLTIGAFGYFATVEK